MNLDVLGPQLHHRSTLDEPLSAEEQVLLDTWYAEQDTAELADSAAGRIKPVEDVRKIFGFNL
jgi:hypothetical protein